MSEDGQAGGIRLDKLLWCLRFAGSRALAQKWVQAGHIRLNGRRAAKPAQFVQSGDVLTLPLRGRVLVIELVAVPQRRGPAVEARGCYRELGSETATDSQDVTTP